MREAHAARVREIEEMMLEITNAPKTAQQMVDRRLAIAYDEAALGCDPDDAFHYVRGKLQKWQQPFFFLSGEVRRQWSRMTAPARAKALRSAVDEADIPF